MTIAHLTDIKKHLEKKHWIIKEENVLIDDQNNCSWIISRPDHSCQLTLLFSGGVFDGVGECVKDYERIEQRIACEVKEHPEIPYLYFASKVSGQFQKDVAEFVGRINSLD